MSVKHIVLFRLKDFADGCSKSENVKKIKRMLDELPIKIDVIKYYEVGININDSHRAVDISIISSFETIDDLNVYQEHPAHKQAVEYIIKVCSESWVSDYIID